MKPRCLIKPHILAHRLRLATMALAAGLLGAGAGCTDRNADTTSQEGFAACSLLSAADVEAVLGTPAGDPLPRQMGSGKFWVSSCNYHSDTAAGIRTASLLLRLHHAREGAGQGYADYESGLKAELGDDAALTPVDGIGERAGWQDFGTTIGQLAVFDGPYQLIVTASATANADQMTNAQLLAERVLPRLRAP